MRLKTVNETINEHKLNTYGKYTKVGIDDQFDYYAVDDPRHLMLVMTEEDNDEVVGEITISKNKSKEWNGHFIHTAEIAESHRGKGLYLNLLKATEKFLGERVISLPYDDDSEKERSDMANKFWAKFGKVLKSTPEGPICTLK